MVQNTRPSQLTRHGLRSSQVSGCFYSLSVTCAIGSAVAPLRIFSPCLIGRAPRSLKSCGFCPIPDHWARCPTSLHATAPLASRLPRCRARRSPPLLQGPPVTARAARRRPCRGGARRGAARGAGPARQRARRALQPGAARQPSGPRPTLAGAEAALARVERAPGAGAGAARRRSADAAYIHGGAGRLLDQLVRTRGADLGVRHRYLETALDVADRAVDAVKTAQSATSPAHEPTLARARDVEPRRREPPRRRPRRPRPRPSPHRRRRSRTCAARSRRLVAEDEARVAAEARRRARAAAAAAAAARRSASDRAPGRRRCRRPPVVGPRPAAAGAGAAVAEAERQLGKPYEWAGAGPDTFDCSGLTSGPGAPPAYASRHSAEYQFRETRRVDLDRPPAGRPRSSSASPSTTWGCTSATTR